MEVGKEHSRKIRKKTTGVKQGLRMVKLTNVCLNETVPIKFRRGTCLYDMLSFPLQSDLT